MAGRADIEAGRSFIRLYVKKNDLLSGLSSITGTIKGFAVGAGQAFAMAGAGAKSVGSALLDAATSFAASGDEINKMSQRTGASVESLSELRHAAAQSGASMGDLEAAMRAIAKKGGTGDPAEKLERLADQLMAIEDPGTRAKVAMEQMGKGGTALLPMMANGSRGIRELRQEAVALGLSFDQATADKATAFGDAWDNVKAAVGASVFAIGGAVAPTFTNLFEIIKQGAVIVGDWVRANVGVLSVLEEITAVAASGNWSAVGNLIVAALNVAWLEAVGFFEDTWTAAKWMFLTIWENAKADLAKIFINAWADISNGWVNTIAFLESVWETFKTGLMNGIQEIQKGIGNFIIAAAEKTGAVTPEFAEAWRQSLNEPIESSQAGRSGESAKRQAEIEENRKRALMNAAGVGGIIDEDKRRAQEALTQQRNETIAAGIAKRDAARAELDASMGAVKEAAKRKDALKAPDAPDVESLQKTAAAVTFSSAGLFALGQGGGVQDRIAKGVEGTREEIKKQREELKKALFFAYG